ncbi:phospholipase C accessory protein PlcR [Pseudomonas edaphica]|uniref:Phospholipase C accessory protein PlcR n=1 Tax=Pseudomonas edaphica TaxID=2006980 RepID=A0ABY2U5H4_9PSED|nr:phospholipase C accessory protein PlcR [Pseudomonas edaphica]TLG91592.1 phospholipase C accessory protein PlcR [Pseudomonas edaphica]
MKTIFLVLCGVLVAYLLVVRQWTDQVSVVTPTTASTPSINTIVSLASPEAESQTLTSLAPPFATLSPAQRSQIAERSINELKAAISTGADLETAYAQAQQLTPYIEADPKLREALDYKIWMDMKSNYIPPAPPTAAQQQQLDAYRLASDKAIDEVLDTVDTDEARRIAIEQKLSALRLEIFGESAPQPLKH